MTLVSNIPTDSGNAEGTQEQLPRLDELNRDVLEWEVQDLFQSLKAEKQKIIENPDSVSPQELRLPSAASIALARVRDKFVNNAEFKELALLCDVLTSAAEAARRQNILSKIKDKVKALKIKRREGALGKSEEDELYQLNAERELEVSRILPFNHKLRELIDVVADICPREQLENWLEKATNGAGGLARQMISGMATEVVVARLSRKLPEVESVRLSTQEEDSRGTDIVITLANGTNIPIDVKTGGAIDITASRVKEVAVEQRDITGFTVSRESQAEIIEKIRSTFY